MLGVVHSLICQIYQVFQLDFLILVFIWVEHGIASRKGYLHMDVAKNDVVMLHCCTNTLCNLVGLVFRNIVQHQYKFLATVSGNEVILTNVVL